MATICCSPPDKVPEALPPPLLQAREQGEHLLLGLRTALAGLAAQRAEVEVLLDAHLHEQAPGLGHVHQAELDEPERLDTAQGLATVDDLTLPRPQDAGNGLERGRLAGAVGADQRHDLGTTDGERQVPQHLDVAVEDVDAADFEQGRISHQSSPSPR
jgi:hypothetical protein